MATMGSTGTSTSLHTVTVGKSSSEIGLDMTSVVVTSGRSIQSSFAEWNSNPVREKPVKRRQNCGIQVTNLEP